METRLIRTSSMAPSVPVLACCRRSDSRAREKNSRRKKKREETHPHRQPAPPPPPPLRFCGFAVIFILSCGIAVLQNQAVCGI